MRANTNIALKERRTVTLTDFRGVDLTTSPLRVSPSRATFMRNLINDHGINHKRPGWSEMLRLDGRINGVFPYQNGEHDVLLVHAGNAFYRATYNEATGLWSPVLISEDGWGLTDTRSQCVYRGGIAYILGCGNYLAYGKHDGEIYTLVPVSEIAYVPTTTIHISRTDVDAENPVFVSNGVTLDAVNLLTPKRINTAIVPVDENNIPLEGYLFCLDSSIDEDSDVEIVIEGEKLTPTGGHWESVTQTIKNADPENKDELYYVFDNGAIGSKCGDIYRYNGQVFLTVPIRPYVKDQPNVRISFLHTASGYADRVHKARFGALFGEGGKADRLFVGGNPDHPDMDFWSAENDFTYFPDGNTMQVGGDQRPMTGYARLSDSVLAIFKESLVGEPSIYYRTGKTTTQIDADGDTVPADYFPITAGTAGDGSVSHHAVANLGGDVLMLSPDGVRGIELSANVSSGERYTRDRGRAIYEDLRKKNLAEAVATVWRGRYFLACGDGTCYVADSRYKTTFEGSPDTQYEWWVWDNVPARTFAVYKDRLLFGSESGKVCGFAEGSFADLECIALESGELLDEGGKLNYSKSISLKQGYRVVLHGGVYDLICVVDGVENGVCFGDVSRLYDGMEVYADGVGESGLADNVLYTVENVDPDSGSFELCDAAGLAVQPSAGEFRLILPLDGVLLYVADAEDPATLAVGHRVSDKGEREWNTVHLTTRDGASCGWTGCYMWGTPVEAEWYSPVMDMGTNTHAKTLLGFTVAGEPGICGRVTFGYETRRREEHQYIAVRGGGSSFSFDDADFNDLSFDMAFATSYTKKTNVRNFNFIACRWRSEEETDSAVSGVTLTYKVNRKNRGVR